LALNEHSLLEARDEAHEMLNPVTSIAGCAYTLLEWGDRIDPATRDSLTRVILRQAQNLERLIRARDDAPLPDQRQIS